VCIDTFDYDETQGEKKVITRVAVGIHDPTNWEITRKMLSESWAGANSSANNVDATINLTHNLIVQNLQTNPTISRMQYSHLSSKPDFAELKNSNLYKLASKVLLFDFSYKLLNGILVYF